MPIVQFRVHPGVGCARMGNSEKFYHLASEVPYFLQERFPNLRFKPRPRVHPRTFFFTGTTKHHREQQDRQPTLISFDDSPPVRGPSRKPKARSFPRRPVSGPHVFDTIERIREPCSKDEDLAEIEWRRTSPTRSPRRRRLP
jgi:hypothetical protein